MIAAAEKIDAGTAINIGTEEIITVIDAVKEILDYTDFHPELKNLTTMSTGPPNRVASHQKAYNLLGWKPTVQFVEGLRRTIDWYFDSKDRIEADKDFDRLLTER